MFSVMEECSPAEAAVRPPLCLAIYENRTIQLDSVPPEVKYRVSGGTFKTEAQRFLADSRAFLASLPS
jgi:hypothetical protein